MRQPLVELTVAADQIDAGSDVLWASGASAIEERLAVDGRIALVADAEPAAVERAVVDRWPMVVIMVDADAALDGWRAHARTERAGGRIVIRPPWVPLVAEPDDLVLQIDPGRAFGSGSHPSTRLALTAIDVISAELPGARVLDVGCGSGVLAVAAARLGAGEVLAIDVDATAPPVTAANAARNGVADRVVPSAGALGDVAGPFDIVLVNISRAASIELAPTVSSITGPGGCVVLSGFLAVHGDDVAGAYPWMTPEHRLVDAGWGALVMRAARAVRASEPSR
ncbi:MAG: 50S ribosomal protein L11 methyltransferase [Acidimicrobiales bacterium]